MHVLQTVSDLTYQWRPTGTSASFVYDQFLRQTQKTVGSTKTKYNYSGSQLMEESALGCHLRITNREAGNAGTEQAKPKRMFYIAAIEAKSELI